MGPWKRTKQWLGTPPSPLVRAFEHGVGSVANSLRDAMQRV
jgi:hypothetical protein